MELKTIDPQGLTGWLARSPIIAILRGVEPAGVEEKREGGLGVAADLLHRPGSDTSQLCHPRKK